jgi:hypothetical protein
LLFGIALVVVKVLRYWVKREACWEKLLGKKGARLSREFHGCIAMRLFVLDIDQMW